MQTPVPLCKAIHGSEQVTVASATPSVALPMLLIAFGEFPISHIVTNCSESGVINTDDLVGDGVDEVCCVDFGLGAQQHLRTAEREATARVVTVLRCC